MDDAYRDLELKFLEDLSDSDLKDIASSGTGYSCFGVHIGWNAYIYKSAYGIDEFLERKIENISCNPFNSYFQIFQQMKEIEIMNHLRDKEITTFLLLPGDTLSMPENQRIPELVQYIEEITRRKDNFICLESKDYNSGQIRSKDARKLKKFYAESGQENINPSVVLFGGQVGSCLKASNIELEKILSESVSPAGKILGIAEDRPRIAIIPDYTSLSPKKIRYDIKKQDSTIRYCFDMLDDYKGCLEEKLFRVIGMLPVVNDIIISKIKKSLLETRVPNTEIERNFIAGTTEKTISQMKIGDYGTENQDKIR